MSGIVMLYPATLESLSIGIETNMDPTGTPPQFSFGTRYVPGVWAPGVWTTAWVSQLTTAVTPTMGATGGLTIAARTSYTLWIKVTLGGEIAEWPVGTVTCP